MGPPRGPLTPEYMGALHERDNQPPAPQLYLKSSQATQVQCVLLGTSCQP